MNVSYYSTREVDLSISIRYYLYVMRSRLFGFPKPEPASEPDGKLPLEVEEKEVTRASLELLYHVSREIASAIELPMVLQRVLFASMRTIGANSGTIIVLDDQGEPVDSTIIHGANVREHTTKQLKVTLDLGLAGWVVNHRKSVLVPDTSKDDRWLRRPDDAESATGAKSAVSAPLLAKEKIVGVLTLVHPSPEFFTQDHLSLVQAIADQAGIAVLNARLYAESQRQTRVMTALAESSAAINASLRQEDVIQRILKQISQALRTSVVSLALLDTHRQELIFQASTYDGDSNIVGTRQKIDDGIVGWVAREGRGAIIPDVQNDRRFNSEQERHTKIKTRSVAIAPIRSQGEVIGILEAANPVIDAFDPDALVVMTGIGNLAGSAIRHAQLFEHLQAAHQRYRDLFEDSIDLILITDLNGTILEANRQTALLAEYEKRQLAGMAIAEVHSPDYEKLGSNFEHLKKGDLITYDSMLITRESGLIPVEAHVHQILIDGRPRFQWIIRDITERKNLDKMRDDLLSMIYHDLRSPLSNVVSSLDVLSSMLTLEKDAAISSLFNIAVRSVERIQRLTNSLLDINRLEAGQPVINNQLAQPELLIREAADAVFPIAQTKKQTLTIDVPEDLQPVMVDAEMIRRVIINLIENAVKFSPPEGSISVSAEQDGEFIQVCVNDTGPGIPVQSREKIFNKFARLQEGRGPKGLGLGLAYCRLAIEGHQGVIWVTDAPGDNGGASFNFTIPIADLSSGK